MLDLGWSEILVIGAIAVVVVGPKEMPRVVRAVRNTIGKISSMAGEFRDTMSEIADTEDYQEIMTELKKNNAELEKNIEIANRRIAEQTEDLTAENKPTTNKKVAKSKKVKAKKAKLNKAKSKPKKHKV